mgnify:CR=1 FL=1
MFLDRTNGIEGEAMENIENIQVEQNIQEQKRWPSILGVNTVYLIVLILLVLAPIIIETQAPSLQGSLQYYIRLFVLELVLVGGPPLIYMLIFKMDIKEIARFNKIRPGEAFFVIGMAVLGYGVMIIVNLIWYWIVSHIGTPIGQELPPVTNLSQLLIAVFTIGLVPALVEEFLFRGLILRGYERFGTAAAIVMTGILFGILHIQLMSIPSIILLGIIISYVVYRTNSIFAGVIYHFVHNTVTVFFLFIQNAIQKLSGGLEAVPQQDLSALPEEALVFAYVFWAIIGLGALALFIVCTAFFHRYTEGKGQIRPISERDTARPVWQQMIPVVVAVLFVIYLIFNEIRYMMGVI